MELGREFSLDYAFHWDQPISAMTQQSIATFGNDEDRIRLANHPSVSIASLESMAEVSSAEVRVAVASNPLTPLESLAKLSHDHDRAVRAAAMDAVRELPAEQQAALRGMVVSPMQRLTSRLRRTAA
jgi:Leucine rich repeat variant